jgi:signal transduction histidine kinase/CheY-like chemotaxis protein
MGTLHSEIFAGAEHGESDLRRSLLEDVVVRRSVEYDVGPPLGRRRFDLTIGPKHPDRVLVHAADTTERFELETQLRRAQKMDALGQLAGGIAHDFNNLLGVMMSYTGVLLEELPPKDPISADLREVESAIERAAGLTGQLLAFGRQQPQRPELVDLCGALCASERLIQRLIGEDIFVYLGLEGDEPLPVLVDVGQLEQVLMNLAVNARDAMPRGGTLSIDVTRTTIALPEAMAHDVEPGEYVRLSVSDTGVGIEPEVQLRMFDPFFTTKEVGKGTGLGLATVYGIVSQSNGFLTVESEVGRGSTFHLFFPLAQAGDGRLGEEAIAGGASHAPRHDIVLLVEDEDALRRVTERVLRRHGFEVVTAATPREALAIIDDPAVQVDCLVSDVVMPGMSGQELAEQVRERRGQIPVLLLSGYARDVVERRGTLDPDMPLLHKPVKPRELVGALSDLLRRQHSASERRA